MQIIILPIKPKYCKKILSGEKKVEFRRRGFRREVTHAVMYSTAPVKKIVGWFEMNFIYTGYPLVVWRYHKHEAGISEKEFKNYYKTCNDAVIIGIKNATPVDVKLSDLDIKLAPQSFYYLTEEQFGRVRDVNKN